MFKIDPRFFTIDEYTQRHYPISLAMIISLVFFLVCPMFLPEDVAVDFQIHAAPLGVLIYLIHKTTVLEGNVVYGWCILVGWTILTLAISQLADVYYLNTMYIAIRYPVLVALLIVTMSVWKDD